MRSQFESLFTSKDIVRAKYPNGWVGWLNDKMSDDDDGRLTRFTTMDGRYMYPSIYEDWYYWESTEGYIYTENEYNKLKNIEGKIELKTDYRVKLGSSLEEFDEIKFLDLLAFLKTTVLASGTFSNIVQNVKVW